MPLFHLILVAVIQGITEFLPVSSSGHLILLPGLTGLGLGGSRAQEEALQAVRAEQAAQLAAWEQERRTQRNQTTQALV